MVGAPKTNRQLALDALIAGAQAYATRMSPGADKREIDRLSTTAPAYDFAVVDAVTSAITAKAEEKDGEIDPMKAAYEARIKQLAHDVDYWKGINQAALIDMKEKAALIADAEHQALVAKKIRELEVKW